MDVRLDISINYHVCDLCTAQVDFILYVLTLYSMCSVQVDHVYVYMLNVCIAQVDAVCIHVLYCLCSVQVDLILYVYMLTLYSLCSGQVDFILYVYMSTLYAL